MAFPLTAEPKLATTSWSCAPTAKTSCVAVAEIVAMRTTRHGTVTACPIMSVTCCICLGRVREIVLLWTLQVRKPTERLCGKPDRDHHVTENDRRHDPVVCVDPDCASVDPRTGVADGQFDCV